MIWNRGYKFVDTYNFYRWFAWYPVKIDYYSIVWLEYIDRRRIPWPASEIKGKYEYKLIKKTKLKI